MTVGPDWVCAMLSSVSQWTSVQPEAIGAVMLIPPQIHIYSNPDSSYRDAIHIQGRCVDTDQTEVVYLIYVIILTHPRFK